MGRRGTILGTLGGIALATLAGYVMDKVIHEEEEVFRKVKEVNFSEPEIIDVKFKEIN